MSEKSPLEKAIHRLPANSTAIGDASFGVLSGAYAGQPSGHPVLLRLTGVPTKRLAARKLRDRIDRPVLWKPSQHGCRRHRKQAAEACVGSRLIARHVQPNIGAAPVLLALFTTLRWAESEILDRYPQRWTIEPNLRALKTHLGLRPLTGTTPDIAAKDIDVSMAAYRLVRAFHCLAAQSGGIPPRGYSFTKVQRIVQAFAPILAAAAGPQEVERIFDQTMYYLQQAMLPIRQRKRSTDPRAV